MSISDLPKLYTEKEIADYLDVSEETLARMRRAGKIVHTRAGNKVRYTAAHLAVYLEKQQQCGTTSRIAAESGTSVGPTAMAPQDAHRLAREIAGKPTAS